MKSISLMRTLVIILFAYSVLSALSSAAQELEDKNADGLVKSVAIGDSITAGLGDVYPPGIVIEQLDGTEFGEGYPGRLTRYLGVPVENEGIPGEALLAGGADRFPSELSSSQADLAIFYEGVNDSSMKANPSEVYRAFQRIANVSKVYGRNLILVTSPTPCCNRAGRDIYVDAFNQDIQNIVALNGLAIADVALAWQTTCQNKEACELFNVPEGLHPNKLGYDVIAQTIAAAVLGIDIFAVDGAARLSAAIGVPIEEIKVKPVQVVAP